MIVMPMTAADIIGLSDVGEQDALRESFPDMPREDRQLLMLRFVREVDQSVDYMEVRYHHHAVPQLCLHALRLPGTFRTVLQYQHLPSTPPCVDNLWQWSLTLGIARSGAHHRYIYRTTCAKVALRSIACDMGRQSTAVSLSSPANNSFWSSAATKPSLERD